MPVFPVRPIGCRRRPRPSRTEGRRETLAGNSPQPWAEHGWSRCHGGGGVGSVHAHEHGPCDVAALRPAAVKPGVPGRDRPKRKPPARVHADARRA